MACFATAVESARISEKAQTWQTCPSTRDVQGASACAEIGHLFLFHSAPKMSLPIVFRSPIMLWRMGQMHQKVAQFVD